MKPTEILHEEQNRFFAEIEAYKQKYSVKDNEGNILEEAIMPHKGFNFSMSYNAFEAAMERYANLKVEDYKKTLSNLS